MTADSDLFPRAMSLAVHELRTPITVVAGYLQMLLRDQGGTLSEMQRKMIEEAERSCTRLGAIVAEMSDLGKLESHELTLARQDLDIARLVAEVVGTIPDDNDYGVQLAIRGTDQPVILTGDRSRLAAVLGALVRATLRERGEPGTLIVDCSTVKANEVCYAVVAIGDATVVPRVRAAALEPSPFDEWRGGLGMALPLARRIIEAHGGAVWSGTNELRATAGLRLPLKG